ncbi:hypothetical protein A2382_04470 [Candidatus Woesebacteria bacterium RIFOXYB1_FULL_38_16]|uniref:Uncharacterized protein n=1 Tax=Candidatus Woesebacteria bacterium RIFOXYB1_FULL_38_16 TaxID=1802538 RepID=A0A1F8CU14_9BACT|nr:MAG: hypothetical protein A2191_01010 [Candidatus Woesebacteria bacterium RIFOXYA1_FULL_38_9]OGM79823.1 MAG: hypothetical protein A2382_04470 [Candidatus Woesebacteria bacterium RIFOXYB1_FULL_38_16]
MNTLAANITKDCGGGIGKGIDSAIGCIPIDTTGNLVAFFLRWSIGLAGGVAFIFIVYAGFLIIISTGDPKKVQAGKELLVAAISGLLLLVFSIFILRIIGVDILAIPGLNV